MAAGLGGVRQYVGWQIFMHKVYIENQVWRFIGGGGGFTENVAVTSSVPKSIYEWPLCD